ncbi:TSUP family transporter [Desulfosediminicola flagellatus]|uniref:TSUP family transporter n=1 Tax=Desulfosediminicola flagellatus TaxID=2569541 RepID=UPI001C3DCF0E|nr:TSUP family transporter [Desulfosediminicola flagellatus]
MISGQTTIRIKAQSLDMELTSISLEILSFLFLCAFVAGFLDTLAGGGGLISLPALIVSGVPPLFALGTNKLQGSMGTFTASFIMLKTKKVSWDNVKHLMLSAFIGSFLGTIAVQFINTDILNFVIPAALIFTVIYFLIAPLLGKTSDTPRLSDGVYQKTVVPVIGWYDGMFGPGTGSFFVLAGLSLRSQGIIDATAIAKTLNFATNIASLIVFLVAGKVVWIAGIVMMLGQFLGAWGGSLSLFKINPQYLRYIVVMMCLGMLTKYAFAMGWFD